MATIHKKLASGQLASSAAAIYSPASPLKGMVKTLILHNTNTTDELVEIYFGGTAALNKVLCVTLNPNETLEWGVSHMIHVDGSAAVTLQGKSTVAAKVNYFLFGAEE